MSLSNLSSSNSNGAFLDYGEFRSGVYIQTSNQILYFTDENGNKVGYQWKGLLPHTTTTNDPNTDGGISDTAWCSIVGSGFIEKLSKEGIDLSWQAHLPTVEVSYNLPHKTLKIWEKGLNSTVNDYWLYTDDGTVWNGVGVLGDIPDVPFKQIVPQNNVIEWSSIATEGQNQFTVPYEFTNISVFINGLLQNKSTGGYVVNGSTVTLNGSLKAGDDIHAVISNIPIKNINYITDVELSQPDAAQKIGLINGGRLQSAIKFLNFDMFNIDKTGTTDVTSNILQVINLANSLKIPIIQNDGIYRISGNTKFTINIDLLTKFDLSGVTLLPSVNTTATFWVTSSIQPTTYSSSSSVVGLLNSAAATDLVQDTGTFDSLNSDTTLNNKMIIIKFSDLAYTYNTSGTSTGGSSRNYYHVTRLSTSGKIDHSLPYTATSIESIWALPISKNNSIVKLPTIDYSEVKTPFPIMFQFFYVSNLDITCGTIINKPLTVVGNLNVFDVQYSYNVTVRDLYDPHPSVSYTSGGSTTASYSLHHGWTCRFTAINCISNGYGWGSASSAGWVCDTLFDKCSFNNIDNHDPHIGYFRIQNTNIGDGTITTIGVKNSTLELENVIFELGISNSPYYSGGLSSTKYFFPALITLRTSSGGLHDGDLKMKNVRVKGTWKTYDPVRDTQGAIVLSASDNFTTLPAGAVMSANTFRNIEIDGLKIDNQNTANIIKNLIFVNRDQSVYPPYNSKLSNIFYPSSSTFRIYNKNFAYRIASNSATVNKTFGEVGSRVSINGMSVGTLNIIGPTTNDNFTTIINITNLRNDETNSTPTVIRMSQRGIYNISDSEISSIITNDGSNELAYSAEINLSNCIIRNNSSPFITGTSSFIHRIKATNTTFIGDYSSSTITNSNTNVAQWFSLKNCDYYNTDGSLVSNMIIWNGNISNTTGTVNLYIAKGNCVSTSLTFNSTTYWDSFNINYVTSGVFSRNISTQTTSSVNTVTGTSTTNVSGTNYSGTTSTQLNTFTINYNIGTRASQAYINTIFSHLPLTSIYVG
ncbi:tail fiber protein [Klebsiella phage Muenster]|nr:tail fiber protein [Klebsiella phage Muenster]